MKITRKMKLLIMCCFLFVMVSGANVFAADQLNQYCKIEYGSTSSVSPGTIRYVGQNPNGANFHPEYWTGLLDAATYQCQLAAASMALSYVNVNKLPKDLGKYAGPANNYGAAQYTLPSSVSSAVDNLINGNGKYSPVVIHIKPYPSSGGEHWLVVAGRVSGNTYQIVEPWNGSRFTFNTTINGNDIVINGGTYPIDFRVQYYNPSSQIVRDYTINFNANGGSIKQKNSYTVTMGVPNYCDVSWQGPTKSGYYFAGWYDSAGRIVYDYNGKCINGTYWSDGKWNYSGNLTVYAKWLKNYTITFNSNGGSIKQKSSYTVTKDVPNYCDVSWQGPTRSGYYFAGWYDASGRMVYDSNGKCINGTYWSGGKWNYSGNLTVYAKWLKNYKITFNANGGSIKQKSSYTVTMEVPNYCDVSWQGPTRKGYKFLGWYDKSGKQVYSSSGKCINGKYWANEKWKYPGNLTVYAKWSRVDYKITFNKNGGSIKQKSSYTVTIGAPSYCDVSWQGPTKKGYKFLGWYDKAGKQVYSSTGKCINGKYWSNGKWKYSGNLTVYAKWKKK